MTSTPKAATLRSWPLRSTIAMLAAAVSMVSVPALAEGGSGGHGGHLHFKGGGQNGFRDGGLGRSSRDSGSGFGYNGGIYGQGVYAPYGNTRCLRRVDGFGGPEVVRVC